MSYDLYCRLWKRSRTRGRKQPCLQHRPLGRGILMRQIAPPERRVRCLPAMAAPAQRPRPLRGRRGARAAPPLDPPLASAACSFAMLVIAQGRPLRLPTEAKETLHLAAQGCARSHLACWRSLKLVRPCSGCGAVAPHLDRGEACRRARGAFARSCKRPTQAPSHAAPALAASAWYVSPVATVPHSFIACQRRPAGRPDGVKEARTTLQPKHH